MYEPTDFTNEGIKKWGAEQLLYASTIGADDNRYSLASVLSECAYELESILFKPDPRLAQQQEKVLTEMLAKHEIGNASPVPNKYLEQAYRETHTEIMGLVKKMVELRTQSEALQKCQGS